MWSDFLTPTFIASLATLITAITALVALFKTQGAVQANTAITAGTSKKVDQTNAGVAQVVTQTNGIAQDTANRLARLEAHFNLPPGTTAPSPVNGLSTPAPLPLGPTGAPPATPP